MIDSHTHIGGFRISSPKIYGWMNISIDDLLKYMKDFNVDKSWLLSHPNTVPGYVLGDDEKVLETAKSYPELIPFCTPSSSDYVALMVKAGCRGIGEIKRECAINDPKLMKIYHEAGEFGLPVVIHTTEKYCYANIKQFEEIFKYKIANFILHGWGWWSLFGDKMNNLLDKYDNVFMDISANSGYKTLSKSRLDSVSFLNRYSDRVLFGTDFPMLTTYDGTQFGVNQHHIDLIEILSDNVINDITFKNAERLMK